MKKNAELVSISALQEKGFGKEVFDKVIVVEFGGETAAFDAFIRKGMSSRDDACLYRNLDMSTRE
jgi:hypothetical protein